MELSEELTHDLNVALNEATLIGAEVNVADRVAALTFAVLRLPSDDGPPPDDDRVQFILGPVGRLAASLRDGRSDDLDAPVEQFALDQLLEVVLSFKGRSVYGWEFLDRPERDNFAAWSDRLSLDWRSEPGGLSHTLDLFQEGYDRHLDLRIWFDELRVFTPDCEEIALSDFAAGGVRWWDGLYANDPRTAGHGIAPLAGNGRTG